MKKAFCILFLLTASLQASAQEPDSTSSAPVDTAAAAPTGLLSGRESPTSLPAQEDSAAADVTWVAPVWTTLYKANESEYSLKSGMKLNYAPYRGWRAFSDVAIKKKNYRGRDMSDIQQNLNNSALKVIPNLYNVNIAFGQDYLRQKAIGLARSGGDMVIENKFANGGFTWMRPELWSSKSEFAVLGRAGGGQNDFKYDENFQGQLSGHMWYRIGPAIQVQGGYGIWRKREDSDVSGRMFENMASDMDTLRAKFKYGTEATKILSVDYERSMGVVRKVDPPRGNSLEVIENPDLAKIEESSRKSEKVFIKSRLEPAEFVSVDFEFLRDYFDQQNVVDDRLSKETELRRASAVAKYYYMDGGYMDFAITRRENDVDYGPVSLSSYVEKERTLKASLSQDITDSLKISLRGSGSLKQRFYKKRDANPRDADYLYYSFLADLDAGLPFNIRAGVKFTYKQYQTINIDYTLSGDNRTDYTYWVVPRFTLRPAGWCEIGQEYEIKMEFTDFNFNTNENFLDRTTIMVTRTTFWFYRSILKIDHRYQFVDTGSYLEPPGGGERLYGRTNESFEHRIDFRYEYAPTPDFSIFTRSNYRFQESNRLGEIDGGLGVVSSRYTDSGEMRLGASRAAKVTEYGKVDLNVAWVKRFGPNLTPERREFWEVDCNVVITF